ncbi:MAG: OmpA family protein [Deltaproteobacteria bacterium]
MNGVVGEDAPLVAVIALALLGTGTAVAAAAQLEPPPRQRVVVVEQPVEVPVEVPIVVKPLPPKCAPVLDVDFATGSARAPSVDATAIVAWLDRHPDDRIFVDGHADPRGARIDNLALSERRARRVADRLEAQGVAPERISVRGFGAYAEQRRSVHVHVADRPACKGER